MFTRRVHRHLLQLLPRVRELCGGRQLLQIVEALRRADLQPVERRLPHRARLRADAVIARGKRGVVVGSGSRRGARALSLGGRPACSCAACSVVCCDAAASASAFICDGRQDELPSKAHPVDDGRCGCGANTLLEEAALPPSPACSLDRFCAPDPPDSPSKESVRNLK